MLYEYKIIGNCMLSNKYLKMNQIQTKGHKGDDIIWIII